MYLTEAEARRFQSKYVAAENGCWLWQGPLDKDGYGTFYLRRRTRRAHRVGWFSTHGPVPNGQVIDHFCQNRHCVNPAHLRAITAEANSLENSRSIPALNRAKTHCPKDHPYDRAYITKRTGRPVRYCSVCEREKRKRLRAKWRAEDTLNV